MGPFSTRAVSRILLGCVLGSTAVAHAQELPPDPPAVVDAVPAADAPPAEVFQKDIPVDQCFPADPNACADACFAPGVDSCFGLGHDSCLGALAASPLLTGDWHGKRTELGACGIGLDADATLFYFGVVDGGREQEFRFAGHNDYVLNMDASKMGGPQGLFVKLRAEHRYGESIGTATGAILPATISADLPTPESTDVYLTNVLFTQMLSETFGVFFGKMDTLDGDQNAFASGRGKTQFSNVGLVITPIALRTAVYSSLGAGFVILKDKQPVFTFTAINAQDTARESGFGNLFGEGVALIPEVRLPTSFFGLPGHQLLGATWSSRNYVSLDQDPLVILPNVPIARAEDSWSVYYNFDQHLYVDPCDPTRGWGVFGRAGYADPSTNPVEFFLSAGVGGSSMLSGREADSFGAGWFYAGTSEEIAPFVAGLLGGLRDGQGVELYYNYAVTPWFHVTPDVQFIVPAREAFDTATVVGVRARVIF